MLQLMAKANFPETFWKFMAAARDARRTVSYAGVPAGQKTEK